MKRLLLTGAGGFIGAHVFEHVLREGDWHIVASDSFRHKGVTDRLREVIAAGPDEWHERLSVYTHDLAAPISVQGVKWLGQLDYIIAMASESSVDRSIADPAGVVRNNVDVALNTLELARVAKPKAVILISTDEVYGPSEDKAGWREWSPILPSNPYSGSKAAQEAIAISYWRTYGVPVIIVNCMNLIGERPSGKFLPTLVSKISAGEEVPVHGTPGNIGTRHYLHARNLADALLFILRELPPAMFDAHIGGTEVHANIARRPDRYNIVGPDRISNLQLAQMVADIIGKPLKYRLVDFHSARPGHDPHYGLDGSKLSLLGWKPPVPFAQALERTVHWLLANPRWLLDD